MGGLTKSHRWLSPDPWYIYLTGGQCTPSVSPDVVSHRRLWASRMMLLSVDDGWYPILIVECLFVGAHGDVNIQGTEGWFEAPSSYIHKHTTTLIQSINCSGSHRHTSYSELPTPSGGQRPAQDALAEVILTWGRWQQYRQGVSNNSNLVATVISSWGSPLIQQSYWLIFSQQERVYLRAVYLR